MSDPRHRHPYWPRLRDGKCKVIIGGEICGQGEDALFHVRQREYEASLQAPPEMDRDEVLDILRAFVHDMDWDTDPGQGAHVQREIARRILEENEIYG